MNFNLAEPFFRSARLYPGQLALQVAGSDFSYADLAAAASRAARALEGARYVGVLASRSPGAYVGILGAAWAGAAYVPMNPKLPQERLAHIFRTVGLDALVVDAAGAAQLNAELRGLVCGKVFDLSRSLDDLPANGLPAPVEREGSDLAYVMFTSGSTGVPKGVMIELGSVAQFLEAAVPRVNLGPLDRTSLTAEITFDVSVFEMFATWAAGGAGYVIPPAQLVAPAAFIRQRKLTVWSSVPALAAFMERAQLLRPGSFPSVRCSVFAGEPLSASLAERWQSATPNGVVENHYGPTEATVYCISARMTPDLPPTPERNTVPIGHAYPGIEAAVLDEGLEAVPRGCKGQLVVAGRQLARGYFGDPAQSAQRFPVIGGKRWYLTGDLAVEDEHGVFHHLGRIDHQVKVLGHRIELEEIETHLREITRSENVAAVAWPVHDGIASGIVGFTTTTQHPAVLEALRDRLPVHMVPRRVIELRQLPLNASGKIDRRALTDWLSREEPVPPLEPGS